MKTHRNVLWAAVIAVFAGAVIGLVRDYRDSQMPTPLPTPAAAQKTPTLPATAHPPRPAIAPPANTAATFAGWRYEVVDAISTEADRIGLPPLLVLALGAQEGGLSCPPVCPTGDLDLDPRGSIGTFQIYCVVHPPPPGQGCEYWRDPLAAMREMTPRWLYYFNQRGGWSAWLADNYQFIAAWAPDAQGSIGWTATIARANVAQGQIAYIGYLQARIDRAERRPAGGDDGRVIVLRDGLTATALGLDARIAELDALMLKLRLMRDSATGAVETSR